MKTTNCAQWIMSLASLGVLLVLAILFVSEILCFPKIHTVPPEPGYYLLDANEIVDSSYFRLYCALPVFPWVAWLIIRKATIRNRLYLLVVWVNSVSALFFSLFAKYMVHVRLSQAREDIGDVSEETISAMRAYVSWQMWFLIFGVILLLLLTATCCFCSGGDNGETSD